MDVIDRTSPIPLYVQLRQILLDKIQAHDWEAGQLIPSEHALENRYGVSRITIRQALSALVNEGYLKRQQGRGTFVTRPKFTHDPVRRLALTDTMLEQGVEPGWRLLSAALVTPSDHLRDVLELPAGSELHRLERLRLVDDEVIGHHLAWVPALVADNLDREAFERGGSLYYLRDAPGMAGSTADRTLEALPAPEALAAKLAIQAGTPIFRIERRVTSATGAPLEFMQASYRGDRFKYRLSFAVRAGAAP